MVTNLFGKRVSFEQLHQRVVEIRTSWASVLRYIVAENESYRDQMTDYEKRYFDVLIEYSRAVHSTV